MAFGLLPEEPEVFADGLHRSFNRATSIFDSSRSRVKWVGCLVPAHCPPQEVSHHRLTKSQDHTTERIGTLPRIKKRSIESLFSYQSPRPELSRFIHASCATI